MFPLTNKLIFFTVSHFVSYNHHFPGSLDQRNLLLFPCVYVGTKCWKYFSSFISCFSVHFTASYSSCASVPASDLSLYNPFCVLQIILLEVSCILLTSCQSSEESIRLNLNLSVTRDPSVI